MNQISVIVMRKRVGGGKMTYRTVRRTRRTRSSVNKCSTPVEERTTKKSKSVRTTKDKSVRKTKE